MGQPSALPWHQGQLHAMETVAESNANTLANDKAMVEVLNPAIVRRANAIKEKEQLPGKVMAHQKLVEQIWSSNKDATTSFHTRVIAKFNKFKTQNAELDMAHANFNEI
jgi:hypothetical protein